MSKRIITPTPAEEFSRFTLRPGAPRTAWQFLTRLTAGVCGLAITCSGVALADGGRGGAGYAYGGTGYDGEAGMDGDGPRAAGGGGGAGGGAGGTGGGTVESGGGGVGGTGGTAGTPNGGDGGPGTAAQAGGGGGGGGYNGNGSGTATLNNSGTLTGGNGGRGGNGGNMGGGTGGGGGGAGGYGAVVTGTGTHTNTGTITGGNGGAGGDGQAGAIGGGGGDGGVGAIFTTGGTFTNSGSVTGGNGGNWGGGNNFDDWPPGKGGVGIEGANLTIVNSGSITGGQGANSTGQADAILFTAGNNTLDLRSGSTISGDINTSTATSLTLTNTGTTTLSNVIEGSANIIKSGTGTITLTGANTYTGKTTVSDGALAVGSGGVINNAANIYVGDVSVQTAAFNINSGGSVTADGLYIGHLATGASTISGAGAVFNGTRLTAGVFANGSLTISDGAQVTVSDLTTLASDFNTEGEITVTGTGTRMETLRIDVGYGGKGTLTIADGAVVSVDGGAGSIIFSHNQDVAVESILNIGNGGLAGTLEASEVVYNGILGSNLNSQVNFNHTNDITFAVPIKKNIAVSKSGSGTTTLTGTSTYTGGTTLNDGILSVSANENLGADSGTLTFNGGTLRTTATMTMDRGTTLNASGGTMEVATGTSLTQQGVIGGLGGLAKTGAGTLILSGTNTYQGGTAINQGSLFISQDANLGSASGGLSFDGGTLSTTVDISMNRATTLNAGGGTFRIDTANLTQAGVISGAGALTKTGTGTLTLSGENTYLGGTRISSGSLSISSNANLGNASTAVAFDNGRLITTATLTMARAMTASVLGAIEVADGTTLTQAGNISGGGQFAKYGTGTLILTGTNTSWGNLRLFGGLTEITSGGSYKGVNELRLAESAGQNATLNIKAGSEVAATGAIRIGEAATGTINVSGADAILSSTSNLLVGLTNTGHLNVSAGGKASSTAWVVAGSGSGRVGTITVKGTGSTLEAEELTLGYAGSGTLTLAEGGVASVDGGTGVVKLSEAVSGTAQGILNIGAGGLAGTLQASAIQHMGNGLAGQVNFNHTDDITFSLDILGTIAVSKTGSGTTTLSGTNTYTEGTSLAGGILSVSADENLGAAAGELIFDGGTLLATAGFTMDRATTLNAAGGTVHVDVGHTLVQAGDISGSGVLRKTGSGGLEFTGNNSYSGNTTVEAGSLMLNGAYTSAGTLEVWDQAILGGNGSYAGLVSVLNGGRLAPGNSPDTITLGALSLAAGSRTEFELGTLSDRIDVVADLSGSGSTGNLTIADGALLDLVGTAGFGSGTYRLFDYDGSLSLDPAQVFFATAPSGYNLTLDTSTAGQVDLVVNYDGLQFWNGTTTTVDGTIHGGNGTWDSATTNWTNENGNAPSTWTDLVAVFTGTAGTVTINDPTRVNGLQFATDGYTLTGTGSLDMTQPLTEVRIDPSRTATLDIDLVGSGGLHKTGAGTVILTGDASYAGQTQISAGTLQVGNGGTVGSLPGDVVNHGTLAFTRSDAITYSGAISGTGGVVQRGGNTLTFTQDQTYSGTTSIESGTLVSRNLANSSVLLKTGGAYSPGGTSAASLTLRGLKLSGGQMLFDIGPGGSDHLTITSGLASLAAATEFVFTDTGVKAGVYSLIDGLAPGWDLSLLSYSGLSGFTVQFLLTADGTGLYIGLYGSGGVYSGPLLQNSAPVGVPTTADFLVEGEVKTGTEDASNTVNSLTFADESSLQVFNELTVTSGDFTVEEGSASIDGGLVIVPGTFTKLGDGTLVTTSDFSVTGPANLEEGSLYVNGTFQTSGGLTVFQDALLGGSGLIVGDVINDGTVAPGNSPGTLTIDGNFTQTADGTLLIEVESGSVFDQLIVTGNAALAGTLEIQNFNGNTLSFGQVVPFLTAGSISGEFDEIVMPDSDIFRGRFLSEDGTGVLLVAPASYTLVAETPNQTNVAAALDSYIPATSGDRETVSLALDVMTAEQYPAALDQIAPTFYESLGDITVEQAFAQTQMLNQRLSAVRLGAQGFQAIGLQNQPLTYDKDGKSVLDAKTVTPEPTKDLNWSLWAMGTGIFAKSSSVNQVPNYRFDTGGFLAGGDYRWSENFATGLYAGYQYTQANYANDGSTQINTALFGGYATYTNGGFYADAVVGGGYNAYQVRRPIEFSTIDRTARSRPDGGQLATSLNLGYDWQIGKFTLGPIAGVQYTYVGLASFTESGADSLDLRVNTQNVNSLRTTFGGRIAYTWNATEHITIIPEVRMLWQHEFLNDPRNISSALDGGAGPTFGYETAAPGRDSVFAGAGVSAQFGDRWNAFFYYNADFGRQDYIGHMISGGLGWSF